MRATKQFLALKGKRFTFALAIGAIACAVVQLALGGSPVTVALCLAAIGPGLLAMAVFGLFHVGSWIALFYTLGNTLMALYSKTLVGQGLDTNLEAPDESFLVLLLSSWILFFALLTANRIRLGQAIFKDSEQPTRLRFMAWGCFIVGAGASVITRVLTNVDDLDSSFGGAAIFRELLFMAVILRTAWLLESSGDRRSIDFTGGLFLVVAVVGGLIDNQKTAAALPVVAYFATVMFYRRGISARFILVLGIGAVVFGGVISPIVHTLRFLGQQSMTLSERAEFISDVVSRVVADPHQLDAMKVIAEQQFEGGYYNYYGADGRSQMLLGRYASVQQIDPVISMSNRRGYQGDDALWPALPRLLPRFLNEDKKPYIEEYYTLVHFGLIDPEGGKFPTLPIAGQSYAAYGLLGVVLVPFGAFLLLFLVLKKLGWSMERNPFAIFFMVQFAIVYASQGSFAQYVGTALRFWPTLAAVLVILRMLSRVRLDKVHVPARIGVKIGSN